MASLYEGVLNQLASNLQLLKQCLPPDDNATQQELVTALRSCGVALDEQIIRIESGDSIVAQKLQSIAAPTSFERRSFTSRRASLRGQQRPPLLRKLSAESNALMAEIIADAKEDTKTNRVTIGSDLTTEDSSSSKSIQQSPPQANKGDFPQRKPTRRGHTKRRSSASADFINKLIARKQSLENNLNSDSEGSTTKQLVAVKETEDGHSNSPSSGTKVVPYNDTNETPPPTKTETGEPVKEKATNSHSKAAVSSWVTRSKKGMWNLVQLQSDNFTGLLQHTATAELTPGEQQLVRNAFDALDQNHDGGLTPEELFMVLTCMGIMPSTAELHHLMTEYDEDNDGEIKFEEFTQMMKRFKKRHMLTENMMAKRLSSITDIVKKVHNFNTQRDIIGDSYYMLHPEDPANGIWDVLIAILLGFTMLTM
jgi:hypothetical protein